jgi:hypothetical protein
MTTTETTEQAGMCEETGTTDDRAAFFAAARAMLDYLEANPDLPVPAFASNAMVQVFPGVDHDEARAVVDLAAGVLDRPAETSQWQQHYTVERVFGGRVTYRVVAIPPEAMAVHRAEQSYVGSVTP